MKQFPTTFPPGSDHGNNTKALPAVWSDRADFDKAAANFITAATKLSQLAKAGDTDGFGDQIGAVGDACKSCHNKFRAK
jgi:cytochrome c556